MLLFCLTNPLSNWFLSTSVEGLLSKRKFVVITKVFLNFTKVYKYLQVLTEMHDCIMHLNTCIQLKVMLRHEKWSYRVNFVSCSQIPYRHTTSFLEVDLRHQICQYLDSHLSTSLAFPRRYFSRFWRVRSPTTRKSQFCRNMLNDYNAHRVMMDV